MTATATLDDCPGRCGGRVHAGQVLCSMCWRRVPLAAKRAVRRAWRTYSRFPSDAAWEAYAAERDAAVATVRR